MRRRAVWYVILAKILLVTSVSFAQDLTGRIGIGFFGSAVKMVGGQVDRSTVDQWGGIHVEYGFNAYFSMSVNAGYGWVYPRDVNGSHFKAVDAFKTLLFPLNLNAIFSFFPENVLRPYISLGGGLTEWDIRDISGGTTFLFTGKSIHGSQVSATGNVGVGLQAFWNDNLATEIGFRYHRLANDEDTIGYGDDTNNGIVELRFLVVYFFSGYKDSDNDGIEDKYDGDPLNPEDIDGFEDADGIPDPDNDGDSIPDWEDKAPNEAEDFDGYQDEDGIPDNDNDGDGIPDRTDKCPDQAEDYDGNLDQDGCPDWDNDSDGIPDSLDTCPNWPETFNGYQDEDGCPDEIPKSKLPDKGGKVILKNVNFASGSAKLTEESYTILDEILQFMIENPEVEIEIRGYTDNQGSASFNLLLSERRAYSVKKYLVNRGIDPKRIRAIGYGERDPIAPNNTEEGRRANRRIEFVRLK